MPHSHAGTAQAQGSVLSAGEILYRTGSAMCKRVADGRVPVLPLAPPCQRGKRLDRRLSDTGALGQDAHRPAGRRDGQGARTADMAVGANFVADRR